LRRSKFLPRDYTYGNRHNYKRHICCEFDSTKQG